MRTRSVRRTSGLCCSAIDETHGGLDHLLAELLQKRCLASAGNELSR